MEQRDGANLAENAVTENGSEAATTPNGESGSPATLVRFNAQVTSTFPRSCANFPSRPFAHPAFVVGHGGGQNFGADGLTLADVAVAALCSGKIPRSPSR